MKFLPHFLKCFPEVKLAGDFSNFQYSYYSNK